MCTDVYECREHFSQLIACNFLLPVLELLSSTRSACAGQTVRATGLSTGRHGSAVQRASREDESLHFEFSTTEHLSAKDSKLLYDFSDSYIRIAGHHAKIVQRQEAGRGGAEQASCSRIIASTRESA